MTTAAWEVDVLRDAAAPQPPAPWRVTRQRQAVLSALHARAGFM